MTATVTPQREIKSKGGMNLFGWLMFIGMIIVLIPLIPFYLLFKLIELVSGSDESVR